MKTNIILAGVGGQGVLSLAAILDKAAIRSGLYFKQSEVHGMSQRGGAVYAHLRISDKPIQSDLIPKGAADMILSLEPLEALRYLEYLKELGILITSITPMQNIPDYPSLEQIEKAIFQLPRQLSIDSEQLARLAGNVRAQNAVMLGAASYYLPFNPDLLKVILRETFESKGERIVDVNLTAFNYGANEGRVFRTLMEKDLDPKTALKIVSKLEPNDLDQEILDEWADRCKHEPQIIGYLMKHEGLFSLRQNR